MLLSFFIHAFCDLPIALKRPEIQRSTQGAYSGLAIWQAMSLTLQTLRFERQRLLAGLPPRPVNRRLRVGSKPATRSAATGFASLSFRTVLFVRAPGFARGFGSLPATLYA